MCVCTWAVQGFQCYQKKLVYPFSLIIFPNSISCCRTNLCKNIHKPGEIKPVLNFTGHSVLGRPATCALECSPVSTSFSIMIYSWRAAELLSENCSNLSRTLVIAYVTGNNNGARFISDEVAPLNLKGPSGNQEQNFLLNKKRFTFWHLCLFFGCFSSIN